MGATPGLRLRAYIQNSAVPPSTIFSSASQVSTWNERSRRREALRAQTRANAKSIRIGGNAIGARRAISQSPWWFAGFAFFKISPGQNR
jgi:hypothetical protein